MEDKMGLRMITAQNENKILYCVQQCFHRDKDSWIEWSQKEFYTFVIKRKKKKNSKIQISH